MFIILLIFSHTKLGQYKLWIDDSDFLSRFQDVWLPNRIFFYQRKLRQELWMFGQIVILCLALETQAEMLMSRDICNTRCAFTEVQWWIFGSIFLRYKLIKSCFTRKLVSEILVIFLLISPFVLGEMLLFVWPHLYSTPHAKIRLFLSVVLLDFKIESKFFFILFWFILFLQ